LCTFELGSEPLPNNATSLVKEPSFLSNHARMASRTADEGTPDEKLYFSGGSNKKHVYVYQGGTTFKKVKGIRIFSSCFSML
jgi:hypothetical protein